MRGVRRTDRVGDARVPVCGRGSLMRSLGMFVFLGFLLMGTGLASGLIPLTRPGPRPDAVTTEAAGPTLVPEKLKADQRRQPLVGQRPRSGTQVQARAVLAGAPCPSPYT
jgi:hypothetical protein